MIFGVECKPENDAAGVVMRHFVYETNTRLSSSDVMKNPFKGKISLLTDTREVAVFVMDITSIYPRVLSVGFVIFGAFCAYLAATVSIWFAIGSPCFFAPMLWSPDFFASMFAAGLRKDGFNGEVRLMKSQELIKKFNEVVLDVSR